MNDLKRTGLASNLKQVTNSFISWKNFKEVWIGFEFKNSILLSVVTTIYQLFFNKKKKISDY